MIVYHGGMQIIESPDLLHSRKAVDFGAEEARETLKILAGSHSISAEQLGKVLGLSVSGVRYHIRALAKESLIRRVGSSKTGYWEVLE